MTKFVDLNLSDSLLKSIKDMGFTTPTEIQAQTIPVLLDGKDVIGQAGTGTGKTLSFAIPTIEKLDPDVEGLQVLVLCPTRELVVQVADQYAALVKHQQDISVVPIYGGQNISIQLKALKQGAQIVVGTPGRIMDHMDRKSLDLSEVAFVVLDEADQMLNMGFRDDMETILKETPKTRQTIMFSATVSKDISKLMQKYQKHPEHINVTSTTEQSAQIDQFYFEINNKSKVEAVKRLVAFHKLQSALIFCNMKSKVDELVSTLNSKGFSSAGLHGDMEQRMRDSVMQNFRKEKVRFLVATDIAARGIDVNDIEAVFNFDLPRFDQDYIHRIGRTGRAGKAGKAFSFVVGKEVDHMKRIARINNLKIEPAKIPEAEDLEGASLETLKELLEKDIKIGKSYKKYEKMLQDLEMDCPPEQIPAILLKLVLSKEGASFDSRVDFSPEEYRGGRSSGGRSSGGGRSFGGGRSSEGRSSSGDRSYSGRSSGGRSEGRSSSGGEGRSSRSSERTEPRSSAGRTSDKSFSKRSSDRSEARSSSKNTSSGRSSFGTQPARAPSKRPERPTAKSADGAKKFSPKKK